MRLAAATVSLGLVPALIPITGAVARGNQVFEEFVTRLPTLPLLGTEAYWQVPFNENDPGARSPVVLHSTSAQGCRLVAATTR